MIDLHTYSDRPSFERLMLLAGAIAQTPGIAPSGTGNFRKAILEAMKAIAQEQGIEWAEDWSEATLRSDLKNLRKYGLLPSGTALRSGYYLGRKQEGFKSPSAIIKAPKSLKSKLSPQEIVEMRDGEEHGIKKSLAEVAAIAGISRERVRQIEKKQRSLLAHDHPDASDRP